MLREKYYKIFLPAMVLILGFIQPLAAQENATAVKPFLEKLQQAYRNASRLGFRVKYRYANARQPGKYIDSLAGEIQLDKNRSRFVIDGTETVVTEKYSINILNDTKVIYLSTAKSPSMMDPAGLLDSVIVHLKGVEVTRATRDGLDWLTIDFPPGQAYTRIRMGIDVQSGYIRQMSYDVHTAGWLDQDQIDKPGHPAPYQTEGHVDIAFSHYQQGSFSDTLFNEGNFFYKTDGRYIPAGKYKDYNIFLASSNL
jgi:hypothetical protein